MREDAYAAFALVGLLASSDDPMDVKVELGRDLADAAFDIACYVKMVEEELGFDWALDEVAADARVATLEAHLRAFLDFYDGSDEPNPLAFFEIMHERAAAIRKDLGEKQTNGEVG